MAFCVFNTSGQLRFQLLDGWKGTITLMFLGSELKHLEVKRVSTVEQTFQSCDFPTPSSAPPSLILPDGTQWIHHLATNQTGADIGYRLKPTYTAGSTCTKGALLPATIFASSQASELFSNELTDFKESAWIFETPNGDTVGIVVAIEEDNSGGPSKKKKRQQLRREIQRTQRMLLFYSVLLGTRAGNLFEKFSTLK